MHPKDTLILMADKKGFGILRDFTQNKDGKFVEPDLEEKCPLLFAFLKILLEEYGITHVALQQMVKQEMHCDPYTQYASPERDASACHVLLTVQCCHTSTSSVRGYHGCIAGCSVAETHV